MKRFALLFIVLAGSGVSAVAAQSRLHPVLGVVKDSTGRPISGAEVLLLSTNRRTETNSRGLFRLDSVPAGERRLLVRLIGYLAVHPRLTVPQAEGDTLQVLLVGTSQLLPTIVVESERPGIRGVVGDTGYHAIPGALIDLVGARLADTTDEKGHFAFENLRPGPYMIRVTRPGYIARLIPVELSKRGIEYSLFLNPMHPGAFNWAETREAMQALQDLSLRLGLDSRRNRLTRAELERYGTAALCDIPRLQFRAGTRRIEPSVLVRGSDWIKGDDLCGWSADEIDLIEFGPNPCVGGARTTIALALNIDCNNTRRIQSLFAAPPPEHLPWISIWPRP